MFDRPRNWKWMVPAALVAPCLGWWNAWVMSAEPFWRGLAVFPLGVAVILFVAAGMNLYLYVQHYRATLLADIRAAESATPEVRLFEASRGMHPEAVKALMVHRRTLWRLKYIPKRDTVDWILDEAPTVHAGFVDFVLDGSSDSVLMSKRLLSEGKKQYDPDGFVTDYQQYDDLVHLMQQKLMCTKAYGNQAPHLLPPWTVELLRKRFGLEPGMYEEEEEQPVTSDQLPVAPLPPAATSPQMPAKSGGNSGVRAERELTDEEWEAVKREMEEHKKKFAVGS